MLPIFIISYIFFCQTTVAAEDGLDFRNEFDFGEW